MPKNQLVGALDDVKLRRGGAVILFLFALSVRAQTDEVRYQPDVVYVANRPSPSLERRVGVGLSVVNRLDSKYVGEHGLGLTLSYNLRHNVSLQLSGAWLFWRSQSSLAKRLAPVKDRFGNDIKSDAGDPYAFSPPLDEYFRTPWYALMEMQIAPIYGKIDISHDKLAHFQVYGSVGFGASGVELVDPIQSVAQSKDVLINGYPRKVAFLGSFGAGVNVMFTDSWGVTAEFKDLVQARYIKREEISDNLNGYVTTGQISHSWMSQLGVKYVF